ncbi:hypothetical protein H0H93_000468 [Arthromyces matolae]|nr:hypothetical protein H0H93_000468 [Arthromyces matolae]
MRLRLLALLTLPLLSFASQEQQIPLFYDKMNDEGPQTHSKPTLADLLTIESSASIFYSYARELELSARFTDPNEKLTMFVPTNKAVMALARKPCVLSFKVSKRKGKLTQNPFKSHEGPAKPSDEDITITEQEFDKLSKKNVENWVSAHIVPDSPISFDAQEYPTLLSDKSITFRPIKKSNRNEPQWSQVTLENGIHIIGMKEASNGALYMIDGSVTSYRKDPDLAEKNGVA